MTMPETILAKRILLPELELLKINTSDDTFTCKKVSSLEICPKCATPSNSVYDHRWVHLKDILIRWKPMILNVLKRRFWCKKCEKPFTEPLSGVLPRRRLTQRLIADIFRSCERFKDLKTVRSIYKVSSDTVYRAFYEQLELERRKMQQRAWPTLLGIDEHGYGSPRKMATLLADHGAKRLVGAVLGKSRDELEVSLRDIPGRENVQWVTMDMCNAFRNFSVSFFPNCRIVADKFHVLRLLSPAIMKHRRSIVGKNADRRARSLLLMSAHKLDYFDRKAIRNYLQKYPILAELYDWKESLHGFYRIRGFNKAARAFHFMTERMKDSELIEIRRLRRTMLDWEIEILNYFKVRLTNARLEGFNNKASLVRRRAFGYKNPLNYLRRLLSDCA